MGIGRSTFYDMPDARARDLTIVAEMKTICDEFEAYGYRRVDAELRHRGIVVNAKKIRRLMREHALNPRQRRRFIATTDSDHNYPIFPNLAKNMKLDGPNQLWVADITYVTIATGFMYLAASNPERHVDAKGNAGNDGDARSQNACSAIDAPEPWRGAGADCRDQAHAGRKSKAHQDARWRQHKNTEAGANEKVRSIEVGEERRQPERQSKQVTGARHAPGDELAGPGKPHALGCHAADACPKDQAEQNDAEGIGRMTEEDAHPLQESDLDRHEADPDQGEINGAAHGQLRAGFSDRRLQRNDDRSADQQG